MLEQQSLYADIDDLDKRATHFCLHYQQELAGYARLRVIDNASIGKIERVVIDKAHRGKGLAGELMQAQMDWIRQHATTVSMLKLSAQLEVLPFYQKWGFSKAGEPYDDAGVIHVDMQKKALTRSA